MPPPVNNISTSYLHKTPSPYQLLPNTLPTPTVVGVGRVLIGRWLDVYTSTSDGENDWNAARYSGADSRGRARSLDNGNCPPSQ